MQNSRKSLDPQTLANIQGLRLRAQHIVEGYVAGLHRSPYHGFSIEFAEHREYVPGDDLRYLDWKVLARTDKLSLKRYEDETNLIAYLVLDISESMQYCGPGEALSKLEYAQCLAASLAWLILRQQDAVSLVTFDEKIQTFVPPASHPAHLQQLVEVMETAPSQAKTSIGPVFHELAERFSKRGVVVVLSDLFDDPSGVVAGLKHFRHRQHDVIVFHLLDPAELDFPFEQPTRFQGLEQLPEVLTDARALRRAYLREFESYLKQVTQQCRAAGLDYQQIRTDAPMDTTLFNYLTKRAKQVR
ncbi:MAG TPA: DUF58 domain-containing protein [Planctomycetaceae bacterium]|nr:DUF58 domain-containing protein [Planctomycetaceae bacterium]